MTWGRKNLGQNIVIWQVLYTLWVCTDHVVMFVLKNNKSGTTRQVPQQQQQPTVNIQVQWSMFAHPPEALHRKQVAQTTEVALFGP